jgi:hypothetical protein
MTNANKVTLPREVAEAIEDVKQYYTNADIIANIVTDRSTSAYGTKMPVLIGYARTEKRGTDTLLAALVNGYEVEKSPEELVKQYYDNRDADYRANTKTATQSCGECRGIIITLQLLGIEIEGVNA